MRPRAVGGMEPDDKEQVELSSLWHLSRVPFSNKLSPTRAERVDWVVDVFLREHPTAGRKWVYVWCERYLGRLVDPDAIPESEWMKDDRDRARLASLVPSPPHAKLVPKNPGENRGKNRAK